MKKVRSLAFEEMSKQAEDMGANAIVGIDIDYETAGEGSKLMVSVSGTAVTIK